MRIRIIIVIFGSVKLTEPTAPRRAEPAPIRPRSPAVVIVLALMLGGLALSGCGRASTGPQVAVHARAGQILAVGAENQYANVISQIGGRYVSAAAIMSSPNTDPHSFEASAQVAQTVEAAKLVVQNGAGYDGFMNKVESASPSSSRRVIDVQRLLGLPESTRNPHLWYAPATMPRVAGMLVRDLSALSPRHAAYFARNERRFDASLDPWRRALARFRHAHRAVPVASSEPVGDYMLQAAGTTNLTPWQMQADIMNGVDPAPQDVQRLTTLLTEHRIKVFLYNQQVTNSLTESFLTLAHRRHVPVVGFYETMPSGYRYQSWMLAEVTALARAVSRGRSTTRLR